MLLTQDFSVTDLIYLEFWNLICDISLFLFLDTLEIKKFEFIFFWNWNPPAKKKQLMHKDYLRINRCKNYFFSFYLFFSLRVSTSQNPNTKKGKMFISFVNVRLKGLLEKIFLGGKDGGVKEGNQEVKRISLRNNFSDIHTAIFSCFFTVIHWCYFWNRQKNFEWKLKITKKTCKNDIFLLVGESCQHVAHVWQWRVGVSARRLGRDLWSDADGVALRGCTWT